MNKEIELDIEKDLNDDYSLSMTSLKWQEASEANM